MKSEKAYEKLAQEILELKGRLQSETEAGWIPQSPDDLFLLGNKFPMRETWKERCERLKLELAPYRTADIARKKEFSRLAGMGCIA